MVSVPELVCLNGPQQNSLSAARLSKTLYASEVAITVRATSIRVFKDPALSRFAAGET